MSFLLLYVASFVFGSYAVLNYLCCSVPVGQGYGLTETCAGAAFSEWDDTSVGRVGPPLPCCYVKVCALLGRVSLSDLFAYTY